MSTQYAVSTYDRPYTTIKRILERLSAEEKIAASDEDRFDPIGPVEDAVMDAPFCKVCRSVVCRFSSTQ